MKNIITKMTALIAFVAVFTACEDDESLNVAEVSEVEALYTPENNKFFNLGASSSTVFEWQASKSADNGVVMYEVVFDEEGGDFSEPLYVIPSNGKGFDNKLTLSFTKLNEIAGMAGIAAEETGKLQWRVWSSKGLDIKESAEIRTIEVERPAGFPTPDELFLTGSATEGGADLSAAQNFVKTGPSTFEIYTRLESGSYKFVTRNTGEPESFYIGTDDKIKKDGETTFTGTAAVYRIRMDFSDGTTSMATIDKVELFFSPTDQYLFSFDYTENGSWEALNKLIQFNGSDERYKFRFTVTTNGATREEWFGSINKDNQRPNQNTADSFWYMFPVDNSRWDFTYKFIGEANGANVDVNIYLNSDLPEYTHEITVL
ncbi:SusE domain-containing protein [Leeuwenhoekiella sp. H156]|uniref:SusE domain-containing protein n=1 Tax=Leeuwenhoekiella sp. H156 TaxID=3450128 RepID=UPI003FA4824F